MFYKSLTASQTVSIAEVLRLAEDDDAPLLLRACRLGFEVERVTYRPKKLEYQPIGIYGWDVVDKLTLKMESTIS